MSQSRVVFAILLVNMKLKHSLKALALSVGVLYVMDL